jgi:ferredoxin
MMKVTIDRDECISCGACYADCPKVFEENDDDYLSQIVEEYRVDGDIAVGEVPDDLEDCATSASQGCPMEIIHVET